MRAAVLLRPDRSGTARWPFVLVIALLAGGGLVALLVLNTATAQSSFTVSALQVRLAVLTEKEQALQQQVSRLDSPEELAKKAAELGMAPGGQPGYYVLNADGSYSFVQPPPAPAAATPAPAADPAAAAPAATSPAAPVTPTPAPTP